MAYQLGAEFAVDALADRYVPAPYRLPAMAGLYAMKGLYNYGYGRKTSKKFKRKARPKSIGERNARAIANIRTGGLVGLELKFFDTSLVNSTVSNAFALTDGEQDPVGLLCLNCPTQGTGASERLGRFIKMKSLQIRFHFHLEPTEAGTAPLGDVSVFVALVLDKQTNNAQLDSEDVYTNGGASPKLTAQPLRDMQHTDRFRVLKSTQFIMRRSTANMAQGAVDLFAQGAVVKNLDWFVNLKGLKTQFTSTGGSVAQIQDNSLHVLAWTNLDSVNISYNSRMRFTTT